MSLSILIVSLIFAIVQAGLSRLLLSMDMLSYLPLVTGVIFALGMAITFVVIMMSGGMNLSEKAGAFVRDHFGKTTALATLSVLLVFVVSLLGEIVYQANPRVKRQAAKADVCYVLDFSSSMAWNYSGDSRDNLADARITGLRAAFTEAMNTVSEGQRVCVIAYDTGAEVIFDWADMDEANKRRAIDAVNGRQPMGGTSFDNALQAADAKIKEARDAKRAANVIMISDGESSCSGVAVMAPVIKANGVRINTMMISTEANANSSLKAIARDTNGVFIDKASDINALTDSMVELTDLTSQTGEKDSVPDTLITPRTVSRRTIIDAQVLRVLILFLMGFWFKLTAIICMGNNDTSMGPHVAHAFVVAVLAALLVEFGYALGLSFILVLFGFWVLMITQIVLTNR